MSVFQQQLQLIYNGYTFSPVPLVSQNYEPLILNGKVWGHINQLELRGYFTGLQGNSNDYENIASIFAGNFGTLTLNDITSGSNGIYNWTNVVVDNISIDQSNYPINGFVNYTIQLKSYSDINSGVVSPENSYLFEQQEDGTVNLIHKISAQGIRTSTDPLSNAINFCNLFTGNSLVTNFIPYGSPILLGVNEVINRAESTYSITENYKFVTGSTNNYVQVSTLNIDQSNDKDYTTLDYNSKYQISPISGNLNTLVTYINNNNYLTEISNLYNISITNIYQNTFSIIQDSGAGIVEVKNNFISGLNNDISGYFDVVTELEKDLVLQRNIWRVNGEWIGKGPLSFRQKNLTNFIKNNSTFQTYLEGVITGSPLTFQYGNVNVSQIGQILDYAWEENSGMAIFRNSITTRDLDANYSLINPKFQVQYQPPKWDYELIPSCNIEGLFVVQDLQMLTQSKVSIVAECSSSGNNSVNFGNLITLFNNLSGTYIGNTGFTQKYVIESGLLDKSISADWLISDISGQTSFSNFKIYGGVSSNFTRTPGFLFGM